VGEPDSGVVGEVHLGELPLLLFGRFARYNGAFDGADVGWVAAV
jgi:hypothetical protein